MRLDGYGVVDFHSHILPQIDDGSDSVEMSLAMLRKEAAQGITRVAATPHFYAWHDNPERFLKRRAMAAEQLREGMAGEKDLPEIILGAEVAYYAGMSGSKELRSLCLGDSSYIMVELPTPPWTESIYEELQAIRDRQGLIPVLAHIDRYLEPFKIKRLMRKLDGLPVLVQANASFFLQRSTVRTGLRLLQAGSIHLLGSDCHNLSSRPPQLGKAILEIERKLGREAIEWVVEHQEQILQK